ncbi:MAG: hypothetical protein ILA13_09740 [Eubacterium sp.]|nr:hypothetical protein [Eubacterium sp.]
MRSEIDKRQLIGIIIAFLGLMWLIIVPISVKATQAKCTETTQGYVDSYHDGGGLISHNKITVKYFADGSPHYYHTSTSSSHYTGEDVTVHYNPNKYSKCYVDGVTDSPLQEALWGLLAIVIGVVEVIVTIAIRKKTSYVSLN